MKDIRIDSDSKTIQFSNNDLEYVRDEEQLAQSIWSMLTTNLNNILPNNGNIVLGKRFNKEYVSNLINGLLLNFDKRIATSKIEDVSYLSKTRTVEVKLKIVTNEGKEVGIGGGFNVE